MTTVMFSLDDPAYDLATYAGRFESMRAAISLRIAFKTNGQIREMQQFLKTIRAEEVEQMEKTGKPHCLRSTEEIQKIRDA